MNVVRGLVGLVLLLGLGMAVMLIWEKCHELDKEDNREASRAYSYIALIVFCLGMCFIYRVVGF